MNRNKKADNFALVIGIIFLFALSLAPGIYAMTLDYDKVVSALSATYRVCDMLANVGIALGSALICTVAGFGASYLVSHWKVKWLFAIGLASSSFVFKDIVPFTLPYQLDWMLTLAIFNVAVIAVIVGERWQSLDHDMTGSALTLGAGRFRVFLKVTLPLLRPAIATGFILVFLRSYRLVEQLSPVAPLQIRTLVTLIAVTALCISQRKGLSQLSGDGMRMGCSGFGKFLWGIYLVATLAVTVCPVVVRSMETEVQTLLGLGSNPHFLVALGLLLAMALITALFSTLIAKATLKAPLFLVMLPWAFGFETVNTGFEMLSSAFPRSVTSAFPMVMAIMTSVTIPLSALVLRTRGRKFTGTLLISMVFALGYLVPPSLSHISLSSDEQKLLILIIIAISYILLITGGRLKRRIHA